MSQRGMGLVILTCLVFGAYFNALHMDFIGDDLGRIVYAKSLGDSFTVALTTLLPDRPLLTASLWINHHWGQLSPVSYKVVSLLFHLLAGFFMFLLLVDRSRRLKSSWLMALASAALFVVHPLNNQAVNSISQRGVLMSAAFSLISLSIFIGSLSSPRRDKMFFVFLFALLAILSKTNAMALPFLFIAAGMWLGNLSLKSALHKALPYFAIFIFPIIYYLQLGVNKQDGAIGIPAYLYHQIGLFWLYIKLFLVPTNLHFIYQIKEPSLSVAGLALMAHGALIVFILWCWRRKYRSIGFFLTAMYIAFLPESSVFPIRHMFFEHRAYLPLLFFLCALTTALESLWGHTRKQSLKMVAGFSIVAAIFMALNISYNEKMRTYDDWVFYNFSKNNDDLAFNIFNLNELADRHSPRQKEFSALVHTTHPENPIYKTYHELSSYSEGPRAEQRLFLDGLYTQLTNAGSKIPQDARLQWIRFYGLHIQDFLTDRPYWEKVDDFLFEQLPALKKYPDHFYRVFIIYKGNLGRLAESYASRPADESWRELRVHLALKHYFGIFNPQSDGRISALYKQLSQDEYAVRLFKELEGFDLLPLDTDRIE